MLFLHFKQIQMQLSCMTVAFVPATKTRHLWMYLFGLYIFSTQHSRIKLLCSFIRKWKKRQEGRDLPSFQPQTGLISCPPTMIIMKVDSYKSSDIVS